MFYLTPVGEIKLYKNKTCRVSNVRPVKLHIYDIEYISCSLFNVLCHSMSAKTFYIYIHKKRTTSRETSGLAVWHFHHFAILLFLCINYRWVSLHVVYLFYGNFAWFAKTLFMYQEKCSRLDKTFALNWIPK